MSWITSRAANDSNYYRYIQFEGGRILQSKELNDLQKTDETLRRDALSAMFVDGALLNAKATVANGAVTLENRLPGPLLAYFNGALEILPNTVVSLPSIPGGLFPDFYLYMHWVLWRVTYDGTYNGQPGCLVDAQLQDQVTGEPVAERGQLQIVLSFSDALSSEPCDPVTMINKSVVAIPILTFSATDVLAPPGPPGVLGVYARVTSGFQPFLQGDYLVPGVVTLTTAGSAGTAVGNYDTRLSDERVPLNLSVYTDKVQLCEETGNTTSIGSPEVEISAHGGGIDSKNSWFSILKAKVHDVLLWSYNQIQILMAEASNHETRIEILEHRPVATPLDLSFHIGKPLAKASNGGVTHPPIVTDTADGYQHFGGGALDKWAYSTIQDQTRLGGARQNGDFEITNVPLLNSLRVGLPETSYVLPAINDLNSLADVIRAVLWLYCLLYPKVVNQPNCTLRCQEACQLGCQTQCESSMQGGCNGISCQAGMCEGSDQHTCPSQCGSLNQLAGSVCQVEAQHWCGDLGMQNGAGTDIPPGSPQHMCDNGQVQAGN